MVHILVRAMDRTLSRMVHILVRAIKEFFVLSIEFTRMVHILLRFFGQDKESE